MRWMKNIHFQVHRQNICICMQKLGNPTVKEAQSKITQSLARKCKRVILQPLSCKKVNKLGQFAVFVSYAV